LYESAERVSTEGQKKYLVLSRVNLIAMAGGAFLSLEPAQWKEFITVFRIGAATLLAFSTTVTIVLLARGYRDRWYVGRAIAESVKTLSWRFMTGAEPFAVARTQQEVDAAFLTKLREISKEGELLGIPFIPSSTRTGPEITSAMRALRSRSFNVRKHTYIHERIQNQQKWYTERAIDNDSKALLWGRVAVILQFSAFVVCIVLIATPGVHVNPVGVLTTCAAAFIAWSELKRFDDLTSAYATAARELGFVLSQSENVDERSFPSFVADAEQAISREHTLWVARRLIRSPKP